MADYRVEVRVKNNNFLRKLEECGYATVGEFCRRNDKMNWASSIGEFVNLKRSPLNAKGEYLNIVEQICEILLCSPEDLFSEVQLTTALETNRHTMHMEEAEMRFMIENQGDSLCLEDRIQADRLPSDIGNLLKTLTPREAKIISMRFGLGEYAEAHTLKEVADCFGVNSERIRQIEARVLRKLRHPIRAKSVRHYIGLDEY